MKKIKNNKLIRIIEFIIGCLITAIAYNIFIISNNLVPGGISGLAVIIKNIFHINNSYFILISNIILLAISYILIGKEKTKASVLGSIAFPIMIFLTQNINSYLKIDTSQILLSTIFGGILFGFGIGLVFKTGFTTGGTDIINQILSKYLKISIGKSILLCDGLIVLSSSVFFGINKMLYSIIILYIVSIISDKVVLGISDSKTFFIITEKDEEVKTYIMNKLKHGVTIFKATGGMTNLPTKDYYLLKEGIKKIDNNAFFIITDTYEVYGGE